MLEGHEYDSRWTVRDKILRYRGLIALYERDKEIARKQNEEQKIETAKYLSELKKEVRLMRLHLQDKTAFLGPIEHEDRHLALALGKKDPSGMVDELRQRTCLKERTLNKLQYVKSLKMQKLEKAMFEEEEIKRRMESKTAFQSDENRKQIMIKETENIKVKHNIALIVQRTYRKMICLMREDALYLDHIIVTMSLDASEQQRSIIKVKEKGERAIVENVIARAELQTLEEKTVAMMRMRDRAIRQLRQQINLLKARLKGKGSEEHDSRKKIFKLEMLTQVNEDEQEDSTPYTLNLLERGMEDLQQVTMVTDYRDIFARLQDQLEHKQRLLMQVKASEKNRSDYYDKRDCLKESLDKIKHSHSKECKRNEEDEKKFREKLLAARSGKDASINLVEDLTKKLLDMRSIIITLHEVVGRVKTPDEVDESTELLSETTFKEIMSQIADPFETLELIKEKVRKLRNEIGLAVENWPAIEMSEAEKRLREVKENQTPEMKDILEKDPKILDDARIEYHKKATEHIARANFGGTLHYLYSLEEEAGNEVGVASRADIKQASRRIVKDSEMPTFGLAVKKGASTLHKRTKPKRRKYTLCT